MTQSVELAKNEPNSGKYELRKNKGCRAILGSLRRVFLRNEPKIQWLGGSLAVPAKDTETGVDRGGGFGRMRLAFPP
jgi:hypothetical protein